MGFKKNQVAGFYPRSEAAKIASLLAMGITDKKTVCSSVDMPMTDTRHFIRLHIKRGTIHETKDQWCLSPSGRERYMEMLTRGNNDYEKVH